MKCTLVTGATGVIGSALVRVLLQEEQTELRLIVRAASDEQLQHRCAELFAFWELDPTRPPVAGRGEVLGGDVCQSDLGLERETYRRLTKEVTHVIHAAGNVKLNQSLAEARRSAVTSLREIISFCRDCRLFT